MKDSVVQPCERPKAPEGLIEVSRSGQSLLLHPELPRFVVVNETGRFIASLCDGRRTRQEIAAAVASSYGVSLDRVSPDVEVFLKQIEASGVFGDANPHVNRVQPRTNKRIHLTITGRCNLRCAHCGASDELNKQDRLTLDDVKSIVDQLAEKEDSSIAITGGEPLLRRDMVDMVRYSCERIKTILSTNGCLIDEDIAEQLGPLPLTYQISLDGATAEVHDAIRGRGSFDAALRGIRLLRAHGASERVEVCRTILRQPEGDLDRMVKLVEDLGIGGIRLLCLARLGRAQDSYDVLSPTYESYLNFYRHYYEVLVDPNVKIQVAGGIPGLFLDVPEDTMWCHIGEMLAVDPEGTIYPCSMLEAPDYALGNVLKMGLQEAAECDSIMHLHEVLDARPRTVDVCRTCSFRNFCQGSCPGLALADSGVLNAEDSFCELRQELFEELFFEILPGLKSFRPLSSSDSDIAI